MNLLPGVVVGTAPLQVRLDGSTTAVPARRLASYSPAAGDRVAAVVFGSEVLVLGRVI
ncbi:hypothetical protein [Kineococcus radiotolerans]|uniref:hypothetical protein n=1 Tax=Kineococcus radiotolerans TaxID=131568 RepID=UPI00003A4157|nr:hypothetical protein [Kineococcus radiotolerans]